MPWACRSRSRRQKEIPFWGPELKKYTQRAIPKTGVPYKYLHFPGVEHGFATRGDLADEESKQAIKRAMMTTFYWFRLWLRDGDDDVGLSG